MFLINLKIYSSNEKATSSKYVVNCVTAMFSKTLITKNKQKLHRLVWWHNKLYYVHITLMITLIEIFSSYYRWKLVENKIKLKSQAQAENIIVHLINSSYYCGKMRHL